MVKSGVGLLLLASVFSCACGDEKAETESLEIEGNWTSSFGGTEVIDAESWSVDFGDGPTVSEVVSFSNDDNDAVVKSPEDAALMPGTYGRNVWTDVADGSFYYCTVSYGKESAEEAVSASEPYDTEDPATAGCGTGDFGWTMLTRE